MSQPSPTALPADAMEKALAFLTRLFLTGPGEDPAAARLAAGRLLAKDDVPANLENRLAALRIAFSYGALDVPDRSVASDLTMTQIQGLRDDAVALHRAVLNRLRAAKMRPADDPASDNPSAVTALADNQALNTPDCWQPPEIEHSLPPCRLQGHQDAGGRPITRMVPASTRPGGPRRVVSTAFAGYDPIARKPRRG